MKNTLFALFALCFLSACGTSVYSLSEKDQEGLTYESYRAGYDDVYKAVITQFNENNWIVSNSDKDGGIVTTSWRRVGEQRIKASANITELTDSVKVFLNVQKEVCTMGCSSFRVTEKFAKQNMAGFFNGLNRKLD